MKICSADANEGWSSAYCQQGVVSNRVLILHLDLVVSAFWFFNLIYPEVSGSMVS